MKNSLVLTFSCLLLSCQFILAQDEGIIQKRERFEFGRSLLFMVGPEFNFGSKADYAGGYSLKTGYLKRLNRILTLGPVLGFTRVAFKPSYADSYKNGNNRGNNIFQVYDYNIMEYDYFVYVVNMRGGNLNQFSLGLNTRVDLNAYKEDKKISFYVVAQPLLLVSSRSKVTAITDIWSIEEIPFENPKLWKPENKEFYEELTPDSPGRNHWANKTEFSGGANLGIGVQLNLPTHWKLYIQPNIRYTFPITHINTSKYPAWSLDGYNNSRYPFVKERFSTIGMQIGIAHNF